MRTDRSDRDLVIGFLTLCMTVLLIALTLGLAVRAFMLAAGF